MNEGRTLELFFIDGNPDGMLTAEVFNWTGHFLAAPRLQIREALERTEAKYTGIYILLGSKDDKPFIYIGEGEDISDRIRNHDKSKDWWEKMILVTSTANNLNKAHVKYLEARLIQEAKTAGKVELENTIYPEPSGLSESARANMEMFLNYTLMILPALKIDFFTKGARDNQNKAFTEEVLEEFEIRSQKHAIRATARLASSEFVVEKGSDARYQWKGKGDWDSTYRKIHQELIETGVLVSEENGMEKTPRRKFRMDYAFQSPSAAAAVILGRPAGRNEWKIRGTNRTYGDWEEERLSGER